MVASFLLMVVLSIAKPVPLTARLTLPVKSEPATVKVLVTEEPTSVLKLNVVGSTVSVGAAVAVPVSVTVLDSAPVLAIVTVPVCVPDVVGL